MISSSFRKCDETSTRNLGFFAIPKIKKQEMNKWNNNDNSLKAMQNADTIPTHISYHINILSNNLRMK